MLTASFQISILKKKINLSSADKGMLGMWLKECTKCQISFHFMMLLHRSQWRDNQKTTSKCSCKTEHNRLIIEVRELSKWIFQKEHFFFCLICHWREQWLCITIKKHWWTGNDKQATKNTKEKHWQEHIDNVFFYNNKALKIQSFQRSLVQSLEWKQNFEKDTNYGYK